MEVKKVFQVSADSTGTFLRQPGLGLYIPAYQRPYSWSKGNVDRFVQDLVDGVIRCEGNEDAMTFLGALIQVVDPRPASVHPKVQEDLPRGVTLVIDGQQRLTTILLTNLCLREAVKRAQMDLPKKLDGEIRAWFDKKSLRMRRDLLGTLHEQMPGADPGFHVYPRMIRAHVDTWSSSKHSATYESPIAKLLHRYSCHASDEDQDATLYDFLVSETDKARNREFYGAVRRIKSLMRDIRRGGSSNVNEMDEFSDTVRHKEVRRRLFGEGAPESGSDTAGLERLLAVGSYLLDRVCVTSVAVNEEDYAFDMFEALNTTGEPLTAYETLRPRIIEAEGLEAYGGSRVKLHVDAIDNAFEAKSQGARRKDTARLITYFALGESGEKRGRKLSEQRQYLRNSFPSDGGPEERIAYVAHLRYLTEFLHQLWEPSDPLETGLHPVVGGDGASALAIRALSAAGHEIAIAPLALWYRRWTEGGRREVEARDFRRVARGLAAFFAIWRLNHAGTANVDGHIRRFVRDGNEDPEMPALARRKGAGGLPGAEVFLSVLRGLLKQAGIGSVDSFAERMRQAPAYERSQAHTRLLLLMASHDSVPTGEPGELTQGTPGVCPMLTLERWALTAQTVEHVAPRKDSGGSWDTELYKTEGAIHRLGNLTILPLSMNQSLGNRAWEAKRHIYSLLSAKTSKDADELRALARKSNVVVPERWEAQHPYQGHVESLVSVPEWTIEVVEQRGEMLSRLAWRTLGAWLGEGG